MSLMHCTPVFLLHIILIPVLTLLHCNDIFLSVSGGMKNFPV